MLLHPSTHAGTSASGASTTASTACAVLPPARSTRYHPKQQSAWYRALHLCVAYCCARRLRRRVAFGGGGALAYLPVCLPRLRQARMRPGRSHCRLACAFPSCLAISAGAWAYCCTSLATGRRGRRAWRLPSGAGEPSFAIISFLLFFCAARTGGVTACASSDMPRAGALPAGARVLSAAGAGAFCRVAPALAALSSAAWRSGGAEGRDTR